MTTCEKMACENSDLKDLQFVCRIPFTGINLARLRTAEMIWDFCHLFLSITWFHVLAFVYLSFLLISFIVCICLT